MKKALVLCLALILVLTMSSAVLAGNGHGHGDGHGNGHGHGGGNGGGGNDGSCQDPGPGNALASSQTVSVGAEVLPYGEIRGLSGALYLGQLSGESGATASAKTSDFQIVRNAPLTLTLSIARPLTVKDRETGEYGEYSINTRAELWRRNPNSGFWQMKTSAVRGPGVPQVQWSSKVELGSFDDYAAEPESNRYWYLDVKATLGDVDDQPAGDYEGEIVLTISAPSGS